MDTPRLFQYDSATCMPLLDKCRRYALLLLCLIEMLFTVGVQFGLNSLILIWKSQNVYGDKCHNNQSSIADPKSTSNQKCPEQEYLFGVAFVINVVIIFFCSTVAGPFFDRFRFRATRCLAGIAFLGGCVCLALVSDERPYLIFPAPFLFGINFSLLMVNNLQVGVLFPNTMNFIVSLYNGAVDSAAAVFYLFVLGYHAGVSLQLSFFILGGVLFAEMMFTTFFLFPKKEFVTPDPNDIVNVGEEAKDLEKQSKHQSEERNEENCRESQLGFVGLNRFAHQEQKFEGISQPEENAVPPSSFLKNLSAAGRIMYTREFILQQLWMSVISLRFQYFLTGFQMHLAYRFPSGEAVDRMTWALSAFLFAGIICAPIAGLIVDGMRAIYLPKDEVDEAKIKRRTLRIIGVVEGFGSITSLLLSSLFFIEGEAVFYVLFILELFTRAILFSLHACFCMAYFPRSQFGTLFGATFFMAGLFSALQFALIRLTIVQGNIVNLVLAIFAFLQPINLFVGRRRYSQDG